MPYRIVRICRNTSPCRWRHGTLPFAGSRRKQQLFWAGPLFVLVHPRTAR